MDFMDFHNIVGDTRGQLNNQENYRPPENLPSRNLTLEVRIRYIWWQRMKLCHIQCGKVIYYYQGYKVKETIMYQDKNSAILLEKNDKESSSRRTNHTNSR